MKSLEQRLETLAVYADGFLLLLEWYEANKETAFRTEVLTATTVEQLQRIRDLKGSITDIEALRRLLCDLRDRPHAYEALEDENLLVVMAW